MPITETEYALRAESRADIRKEVIELFLLEKPGTGSGDDCSKYRYIVESIPGYSIKLKRPVPLNKGFDFTVNVEGLYFKKNRRYNNPSHRDIKAALIQVRDAYPSGYAYVKGVVPPKSQATFLSCWALNSRGLL